jgi:hypothetical protein
MQGMLKKICLIMLYGSMPFVALASSRPLEKYPAFIFDLRGANKASPIAQGNVLWPFFINNERAILFSAEGKYSQKDNSYSYGAGAIFRQLESESHINGVYFLVDQNSTASHHYFWSFNPGIERLGRTWDIRLNGYIPSRTKCWIKQEGWADQFGDYGYVRFAEHNKFNRWLKDYEETGPGGDVSVSYHFQKFKNLDLTVSGYHFQLQNTSNMDGGELHFNYALNSYLNLYAGDSYDNKNKNIINFGVRIAFDKNKQNLEANGLSDRLLSPVERSVGSRISGTVMPFIDEREIASQEELENDHVWFVDSGAGSHDNSGDGTFEHPYTNFNQTVADAIYGSQSNADIYIERGSYNLSGQVTVNQGLSIFGRTDNFIKPASNDDRPLLYGGLSLKGDNTIDSIRLKNDTGNEQTYGILIDGSAGSPINNITINNVLVGANDSDEGFQYGMKLNYASNVTIKDSTIRGYIKDVPDNVARGLWALYSSFTVDHSTISAKSEQSGAGDLSSATGIRLDDSTATIKNHSTLSADSSSTNSGDVYAYGIGALSGSTVTMNDSSVESTVNNTVASSVVKAYGIYANDSTLKLTSINLNAHSEQLDSAKAYGIYAEANSDVTLSGTNIITAKANAAAFGIYGDNSTMNVSNTTFNINVNGYGFGGYGYGIFTDGGTLTQNNNTFNRTAKYGSDVGVAEN